MTSVTIKGAQHQVHHLSLADLRTLTREGHMAHLTSGVASIMSAEQVDATIAIIAAALHQQRDWVADNVSVQEVAPIFQIVLEAAGFVKGSNGPNAPSP